jgi:hypothetical protein
LFTISISNYFYIGAILQKFKFEGKYLLVYLFSVTTMWIVANFVNVAIIKALYGYVVLVLIGLKFQRGIKKLLGALCIILELSFTVISMMTRNIPVAVQSDYLTTFILLIDFYIMCSLYFLYSNLIKLKGESTMAILVGFGLLSKEEAQKRGYSNFKRFCHNARYIASFKWAKKK